MPLTAGALNRATLARQLLLEREHLPVAEAVRRVVALQAQEAASPYLALWNRVAGFDPADLDAAFVGHTVVKSSLLRLTLHAVHAADHPVFHHVMAPSLRASRVYDNRFTGAGLAPVDADALVPHLLEYAASPRTTAEIEDLLTGLVGEHRPRLWWALRMFAPLLHVPDGGPWSFGRGRRFRAAPGLLAEDGREESTRLLVRRYLEGFGPAGVADVGKFTMLRRPDLRAACTALCAAGELEELAGPDATPLYDVPGAPRLDQDVPAPPRLLPMWDNVLLAYADNERLIPPDLRALVIRRNGDVLPTVLVDGSVAGVWRPVDGRIEVTAYRELSEGAWSGLATEAAALVELLAERQPEPYRRFAHWWTKLPDGRVRLLPG